MNFLVAAGTSAAYLYSVVLILLAVSTSEVRDALSYRFERLDKKLKNQQKYRRLDFLVYRALVYTSTFDISDYLIVEVPIYRVPGTCLTSSVHLPVSCCWWRKLPTGLLRCRTDLPALAKTSAGAFRAHRAFASKLNADTKLASGMEW